MKCLADIQNFAIRSISVSSQTPLMSAFRYFGHRQRQRPQRVIAPFGPINARKTRAGNIGRRGKLLLLL